MDTSAVETSGATPLNNAVNRPRKPTRSSTIAGLPSVLCVYGLLLGSFLALTGRMTESTGSSADPESTPSFAPPAPTPAAPGPGTKTGQAYALSQQPVDATQQPGANPPQTAVPTDKKAVTAMPAKGAEQLMAGRTGRPPTPEPSAKSPVASAPKPPTNDAVPAAATLAVSELIIKGPPHRTAPRRQLPVVWAVAGLTGLLVVFVAVRLSSTNSRSYTGKRKKVVDDELVLPPELEMREPTNVPRV